MKFTLHHGRRLPKVPPVPELGFEFICCTCGDVCRATWQDIGFGDRREMAWRSDCCGSLIDENPKGYDDEPPA
jgi:hypothetical protein